MKKEQNIKEDFDQLNLRLRGELVPSYGKKFIEAPDDGNHYVSVEAWKYAKLYRTSKSYERLHKRYKGLKLWEKMISEATVIWSALHTKIRD